VNIRHTCCLHRFCVLTTPDKPRTKLPVRAHTQTLRPCSQSHYRCTSIDHRNILVSDMNLTSSDRTSSEIQTKRKLMRPFFPQHHANAPPRSACLRENRPRRTFQNRCADE